MGTTFQGRIGGDAHGIARVRQPRRPSDRRRRRSVGNELFDLALGSTRGARGQRQRHRASRSRATCVHDTNNIGIVAIGYEGTAPDPIGGLSPRRRRSAATPSANVDSYGNPAYGTDRSADGIYVDGGRDVLVEGNVVHDVNIGHGVRERARRPLDQLRDGAEQPGLRLHGDRDRDRRLRPPPGLHRGRRDREQHGGAGPTAPALLVQFDTRDNVIAEQRVRRGPDSTSSSRTRTTENAGNVVDHNLYWSDGRAPRPGRLAVEGHASYPRLRAPGSAAPASTRHSDLRRPGLRRPGGARLSDSTDDSPGGRRRRVRRPSAGSTDLAGRRPAQQGGRDRPRAPTSVAAPPPSPTPSLAGPRSIYRERPRVVASQDNGWGDPPSVDRSNGERAPDDGGPLHDRHD